MAANCAVQLPGAAMPAAWPGCPECLPGSRPPYYGRLLMPAYRIMPGAGNAANNWPGLARPKWE